MMQFWCNHCEQDFDSEPDSESHDQANCPECDTGCLTFETEYEDAKRRSSDGAVAGSVLTNLFGWIFPVARHAADAASTNSNKSPILEFAEQIQYRKSLISTLSTQDDADDARYLLSDRQIDGFIIETPQGFELYVDDADEKLARRFVEGWLKEMR